MRDPKRIAKMLQELGEYWMNNPDLRLGQIVTNMTPISGSVFYVEDDAVLNRLKHENGHPSATGGRFKQFGN